MRTTWDYTGQRALIAGAGGIGTVIAEALANAGAKVAVLDIDKRRLTDTNPPAPGAIFGITADLTSHRPAEPHSLRQSNGSAASTSSSTPSAPTTAHPYST